MWGQHDAASLTGTRSRTTIKGSCIFYKKRVLQVQDEGWRFKHTHLYLNVSTCQQKEPSACVCVCVCRMCGAGCPHTSPGWTELEVVHEEAACSCAQWMISLSSFINITWHETHGWTAAGKTTPAATQFMQKHIRDRQKLKPSSYIHTTFDSVLHWIIFCYCFICTDS